MATQATKVTKEKPGNYVLQDNYGNTLAEAGALNFKGEAVALDVGNQMSFNKSEWQVDKMRHKAGVIFIE